MPWQIRTYSPVPHSHVVRVKRIFEIASSPLNTIENDKKKCIYIDYDCLNRIHIVSWFSRSESSSSTKPRAFTRCEQRCASGLGRRQRVSQPNTTDTWREHLKNDWSGKWNQNRARQKPFRWLAFPFRTFALVVTIYLVSYSIWYPLPTRVPCWFVHFIFCSENRLLCFLFRGIETELYWFSIRVIQRWRINLCRHRNCTRRLQQQQPHRRKNIE